jgi:hypothetical protein
MRNAIANGIGVGLTDTLSTGLGSGGSTTFITPLTVKGGVVRVIDDATGDIARTTSGWIEDEKFGVYAIPIVDTSFEFDTAVTRTGEKTVKVSTTSTSGRGRATFGIDPNLTSDFAVSDVYKYGIPVKPSTAYKLTCYAKTDNAAADSVYLYTREINTAGARVGTQRSSNKLTGNNDWTKLEASFTTDANAAFIAIGMLNNIAGNISDAWFDVNSMTLEEVSTITNSGSSPSLLYPKFTAVSSTDNIDQSQVVADGVYTIGAVSTVYRAQQFIPTKKNLTGFSFKKQASTGTFTGTITMSIQADAADVPSGTALGTPVVLTNTAWDAITNDTEYTVSYPLTLNTSLKYWIVYQSSTADDSNCVNVSRQVTGSYAGLSKFDTDALSWSTSSSDYYFKTLYSKNTTNFTVSTDTQTVSVTAPTVDGWEDGTVVGFGQSLTLAPGANDIYVSSNGPATADGTVDPSLQGILGGSYAI